MERPAAQIVSGLRSPVRSSGAMDVSPAPSEAAELRSALCLVSHSRVPAAEVMQIMNNQKLTVSQGESLTFPVSSLFSSLRAGARAVESPAILLLLDVKHVSNNVKNSRNVTIVPGTEELFTANYTRCFVTRL